MNPLHVCGISIFFLLNKNKDKRQDRNILNVFVYNIYIDRWNDEKQLVRKEGKLFYVNYGIYYTLMRVAHRWDTKLVF